jgi:hypothetical protein
LGGLTEPLLPFCEGLLRYIHNGLNHGSRAASPASERVDLLPVAQFPTLAAAYAAVVTSGVVTALSSEVNLLLEELKGHHCGQWPRDVAQSFAIDAVHYLLPVLARFPLGFRRIVTSNLDFGSKYPEDAERLRAGAGKDGHEPDKGEEVVMEEDAESLKETADISLPFQADTDTRRHVKTKQQV